jgi:hypothetical protein
MLSTQPALDWLNGTRESALQAKESFAEAAEVDGRPV